MASILKGQMVQPAVISECNGIKTATFAVSTKNGIFRCIARGEIADMIAQYKREQDVLLRCCFESSNNGVIVRVYGIANNETVEKSSKSNEPVKGSVDVSQNNKMSFASKVVVNNSSRVARNSFLCLF